MRRFNAIVTGRVVSLEALDSENRHRDAIHRSPMIAPDQDPERATAQHQIRTLLEQAIDDLPETFRTVFVMRDIEEASTVEPRVLELSQQTVKTRLHRARRMLRAALGGQIGILLKDTFPFDKPRCDRLIERVLDLLGFTAKSLSR